MSNLLAQIILARRSPGDNGWMNILVVIVMAVIWVVGGVVKAMKTKSQDQQQPGRVPPRKPPGQSMAVQQDMPAQAQRTAGPAQHRGQPSGVQAKRTTLADLRAVARRFAAEAEQAFQAQTTRPTPKPPAAAPEPGVRPETMPSIPSAVEPIKGLTQDQSAAAKMPPTELLSDLISDYTNPERLRKAILHYEILGPPLSLRD